MKEMISKISFSAGILFYLFSCGSIYEVAYWSTFDFDVTNYIDFLDIPKSFVFPLATGIGVSFIAILIQGIQYTWTKIEKDEKANAELLPKLETIPTKKLIIRLLIDLDVWAILILIICLSFFESGKEWVYGLFDITLIIYGVGKFVKNSRIRNLIPHFALRLFVAILIIFIPVHSFTIGKLNSRKILKNQAYFRISEVKYKDPSSLSRNIINCKLLGKLGSNLFVSDTANTQLIVVNLESISSIEYLFVKK